MKFVHRLGYYLGGFAIGLIILAFILSGKNTSCDYGPNARTVKNISSKPLSYSATALQQMKETGLDSTTVKNLITYGEVDFTNSLINKDSCNTYIIENSFKDREYILSVLNCDEEAVLKELRTSE
jgi:hypothetical protein